MSRKLNLVKKSEINTCGVYKTPKLHFKREEN